MVTFADNKKNTFLADLRKEMRTFEPRSEPRTDLVEQDESTKMKIATGRQRRLEIQLLIAGVVTIIVAVTCGTLYLRAIEGKQCEQKPIVCQM